MYLYLAAKIENTGLKIKKRFMYLTLKIQGFIKNGKFGSNS